MLRRIENAALVLLVVAIIVAFVMCVSSRSADGIENPRAPLKPTTFHKPLEEIGAPPERPRVKRDGELPKPEDISVLCYTGRRYWGHDAPDGTPAVAPRVFARIVSVMNYQFHSDKGIGASALLVVSSAGDWPDSFYVGVKNPDGWMIVNFFADNSFSWDRSNIMDWTLLGQERDGVLSDLAEDSVHGIGRRKYNPPDWMKFDGTHRNVDVLVLMRRSEQ